MNDQAKAPSDCQTMIDVRAGVDATDRALVDLLETRFGYMRAAARIKTEQSAVRDEDRKAAVIDAVRQRAAKAGIPADALAEIWDSLVETSIAYEMTEWKRLRR
ncbi:chorismate mutase [Altererythrobacter luteolus]|uniref:chorismate mutase n=1 Tax=Pontixanthobacter luteolus TaxID=295089 RepID=A0A6I4V431_9SPHN|nr:chorismate mutase [Pontixanthobacter luteolus]MXP46722.1 chorismate mutase [Pontixanthobacter luteolus]